MATKTLSCTSSNSSWFKGSAHLKVTYTASNGTFKITELAGYDDDGIRSWDSSKKSVTVKAGNTSKTVKLGHYVDFGKSGYTSWSATDTSWTGLTGSSVSFTVTLPSSSTTFSGSKFTGSVTMSWSTYTISYNANGGAGAPSSQTKTYGTALTLSSTVPTRSADEDGTTYIFKGWATSADATAAKYMPGVTYSANASTTLYAVWSAIDNKTVSYNANGGEGAPEAQNSTISDSIVISSIVPTRNGYTFKGWTTNIDSTTVVYEPGATYSGTTDLVLYAVWEPWTHTIIFNAMGGVPEEGNVAITEILVTSGQDTLISDYIPVKSGYIFQQWNTEQDGSGISYYPNQEYLHTQNGGSITLYAIWKNTDIFIYNNHNCKAISFYEGDFAHFVENGVVYAPEIREGETAKIGNTFVTFAHIIEK